MEPIWESFPGSLAEGNGDNFRNFPARIKIRELFLLPL